MSNYTTQAKRKYAKDFETVDMIDDYFGKHQYGVVFPDGQTLHEEEVDFFEEDLCTKQDETE